MLITTAVFDFVQFIRFNALVRNIQVEPANEAPMKEICPALFCRCGQPVAQPNFQLIWRREQFIQMKFILAVRCETWTIIFYRSCHMRRADALANLEKKITQCADGV
jgi:hypothetical protein